MLTMEYTKAFELIADKVGEELTKQGYTRQKVASEEGKLVALFTSQNVAYSVVYVIDKQQMLLRSCAMTDEGPDNEWKTLSTWLYDDYVASQKDAESIANDFVDGVSNTSAIKRAKQVKQKKKKEDGTADPKFLAKRFVTYFPELKDEIKNEEDCYYPFRGAAERPSQRNTSLPSSQTTSGEPTKRKPKNLPACSTFSTATAT